jgi:hypothetical protein
MLTPITISSYDRNTHETVTEKDLISKCINITCYHTKI